MAIKVKRNMLQYEYSWGANGDDDRPDRRDARFFNQHEGYEVVPMIQKIVDHFDYKNEEDVQKVEYAIKEGLPGRVRGRSQAFDWLVDRLGETTE